MHELDLPKLRVKNADKLASNTVNLNDELFFEIEFEGDDVDKILFSVVMNYNYSKISVFEFKYK